MKQLQSSIAGKIGVWLLLLAVAFVCAFFSARLVLSIPLLESNSWQETNLFNNLIQDREYELASYFAQQLELEDGQTLTYMERQQRLASIQELEEKMAASATRFRFQVKTSDGQIVLYTNLKEGESLAQSVGTIHYAFFTPGEHYVTDLSRNPGSLTSFGQVKDNILVNSDQAKLTQTTAPYVIECGVPVVLAGDTVQDEFSSLFNQHRTSQNSFPVFTSLVVSAFVIILLCIFYVMWTSGHKTGVEGIVLSWQERIFYDIYLSIMFMAGTAAFVGAMEIVYYTASSYYYLQESQRLLLLLTLCACALATLFVVIIVLTLRTTAVRIKAGVLAQTTLICRIVSFIWRFGVELVRSLPFLWRVIALFLVYFIVNVLLFSQAQYDSFAGFLLLCWNALAMLVLCWWSMCFRHLGKASHAIAAGNLNHRIDTARMPHDLKVHAEELNNISVGLASAVDEKMKSERFKAELITNVSHDLKTPLTSIINYVNLLMTTQQTDPKAQEYIEVLDRKSQRLKKLTEDLVEASKASTGVLSVTREKIGMAQLIDQALGEWDEKLNDRSLTVVTALPEGETWVYADGRHLWRVIDNLLSNCAKYAMEGTRVYMDLVRGHGQVNLSVKNISRDALNVPPERLMERFVRGEEARSTEGSGLGLSIARSLTELQGGTFSLTVDGDLFKATVTLPQAN